MGLFQTVDITGGANAASAGATAPSLAGGSSDFGGSDLLGSGDSTTFLSGLGAVFGDIGSAVAKGISASNPQSLGPYSSLYAPGGAGTARYPLNYSPTLGAAGGFNLTTILLLLFGGVLVYFLARKKA